MLVDTGYVEQSYVDAMLDESICAAMPAYTVEEVYEVLTGKE